MYEFLTSTKRSPTVKCKCYDTAEEYSFSREMTGWRKCIGVRIFIVGWSFRKQACNFSRHTLRKRGSFLECTWVSWLVFHCKAAIALLMLVVFKKQNRFSRYIVYRLCRFIKGCAQSCFVSGEALGAEEWVRREYPWLPAHRHRPGTKQMCEGASRLRVLVFQ